MVFRLSQDFFERPTIEVCKDALGKFLVRKKKKETTVGKIVEVEAYMGPRDKAAHVRRGKVTKRNRIVFGKAGNIYIYLVYGMYWQLNITTEREDKPQCFLIRALEPIQGFKQNLSQKERRELANGPGKLCRWMELDGSFYGEDLESSSNLWIEERGGNAKPSQIVSSPRIGIDYAGEWKDKELRFHLKENKFVSKRR